MNDTEDKIIHLTGRILGPTIFGFLAGGIIGFTGNLFAAVALATSQKKFAATTILVMNLSVGILPICLLTMPFIASLCFQLLIVGNINTSDSVLQGFYILTSVCNQVEIHTIMALSFNRACGVVSPTFYKRHMNKPTIIWSSLTFIWVYSIVLWMPVLSGVWGHLEVHEESYFVKVKDENKARTLISLLFWFFIPFITTVGCHLVMLHKFRKSRFSESGRVQPWKNHVTKTLTIIFLLQCLFSIPHFIVHTIMRGKEWPKLWLLLHAIYFFRFCLNPLVYMYSSNHYRKDCIRLLKKIRCSNTKTITIRIDKEENVKEENIGLSSNDV